MRRLMRAELKAVPTLSKIPPMAGTGGCRTSLGRISPVVSGNAGISAGQITPRCAPQKGIAMTGNTLVYGVGLNDADYVTQRYEQANGKQKLVWACPIYQAWKRMLRRANCKAYLAERPTYQGVTVCMEWRTFSCFASWMKCQDWEGKQLDKDLLHPGNKEYSPDTCTFVSNRVNSLLTNCSSQKGDSLIGVYWRPAERKFVARARSFGKSIWLGRFDKENEAHAAWQAFKADEIEREANILADQRVAQALLARAHRLRSDRAAGLATTQL